MHPTMERLWMYSVMTGQMTDMTWPDSSETSEYGDISNYADSCLGHGGSDVFPFGILDTDTDGFTVSGERWCVVQNFASEVYMYVSVSRANTTNAA